jgi:hypothetical protein
MNLKGMYVLGNLLCNINIANHSSVITVALFKKMDDNLKDPVRTVVLFVCFHFLDSWINNLLPYFHVCP